MSRIKHYLHVGRFDEPFIWATPQEGAAADELLEVMWYLHSLTVERLVVAAASGDGAPHQAPQFWKNLRAIVLDEISVAQSDLTTTERLLAVAPNTWEADLAEQQLDWLTARARTKTKAWESWRRQDWLWLLFTKGSHADQLNRRLAATTAILDQAAARDAAAKAAHATPAAPDHVIPF